MSREIMSAVFPRRHIIYVSIAVAFFVALTIFLVAFSDLAHALLYRPDRLLDASSRTEANYSYWSLGHIAIIVTTFVLFGLVAWLSFKKKHLINIVMVISAVAVGICAAGLLAYSFITGNYNLEWYIPVHICNFFILLLPLCSIFKNKFRGFFMDYMVAAGIVGCILATVFPMTTMLYYPPFHIVPLLCWIHHLVIGLLGIYLVSSGNYTRFNWFKLMSVVWALVFASAVVNYFTGTNFIFLNNAHNAEPITWFQMVLGQQAVFIMLGLFTLATFIFQIALDFWLYIRKFTLRDIILWIKVQIDPITPNKFKERGSDFFKFLTEAEIKFFMDTPIELLSDPKYLYTNLKRLGTFSRFARFTRRFRKHTLSH